MTVEGVHVARSHTVYNGYVCVLKERYTAYCSESLGG